MQHLDTMMLSSAFAFFTTNIETKFTMSAAEWDVFVDHIGENEEVHEFYLHKTNSATATEGYCLIEITNMSDENDKKVFCTKAFSDNITIYIQMTAEYEVDFIPKWGNPLNYGFDENETYGKDKRIVHSYTSPKEASDDEEGIEAALDESDESSADVTEDSDENSETPSDNQEFSESNSDQSDETTDTLGSNDSGDGNDGAISGKVDASSDSGESNSSPEGATSDSSDESNSSDGADSE